jgi:hypothetical protein
MSRKRILFAALILGVCAASLAQPQPPTRGEELNRLDFLAGEWSGRLQRYLPSGETLELEPRVTFEWGAGGIWLRGRDDIELPDGGVSPCVSQITWDPDEGVYVGSWQDNVVPGSVTFEGRWLDEKRLELDSGEFDLQGRRNRVIVTYAKVSENEFRTVIRQSRDNGEPKTIARGRFRKGVGSS